LKLRGENSGQSHHTSGLPVLNPLLETFQHPGFWGMGRNKLTNAFSREHGETEMKEVIIVSRGGEIDNGLIRLVHELFPGCEISVVSHEHEDPYRTFSGVEIRESP
jgi:hypothetical protein